MLQPSICRFCHNGCSILVEVEDGRAVRVTGDEESEIYRGYTCVKGRALPEQLAHPERLLQSQKRQPDGSHQPIGSEELMHELAERVGDIIERHGPRSVAFYLGSGMACAAASAGGLAESFRAAIGSPMRFTSDTIDQPGKQVAKALHGSWMAPPQGFDRPDVALIVGGNPLVTHAGGLPVGSPGRWLNEWLDNGLDLIVVDPRRSDIARRAAIHLQSRPGEDVSILAGLIRVILTERLHDAEFVDEHVEGVDRLVEVVKPFTPEYVAARADIDADALVDAARRFAAGNRGYAVGSTGPNMSGPGTLFEYLILSLNTLCGRWLRAGERVAAPLTLLPERPPKAQASPPVAGYDFGESLYGTGLRECSAGIPAAGMPHDILSDAPDRVRVLFSLGGNPVAAWPDQLKTIEAMDALELLVQVDIRMSATARLADYVVATKMSLETPSFSMLTDMLASYAVGYIGSVAPWAQYTPAIVDPPAGSDVIEEWELFYGMAQRMDLELKIGSAMPLDMLHEPTSDDLLGMIGGWGRVPLDEVKRHPHGAVFDGPAVYVGEKDPDWTGRLDVANEQMMIDLLEVAHQSSEPTVTIDGELFEFRLVSRRLPQVYNSSGHALAPAQKRPYNPAFLHPDDLERLGLREGDLAEIRSPRAAIVGIVQADPNLRPGLVSMAHAYGDTPEHDDDFRSIGSPTSRLVTLGSHQPYTGQPQMSNVPLSVRRWEDIEAVSGRT